MKEGNRYYMNKKSMALSISFPLLSIIVSGILMNLFHMDSVFIITLGIICGGVLPMFIIVFLKADISKFFVGKIVLFVIFFIGIFFSWFVFNYWLFDGFNMFALPVLIFIAEAVFAITRKTNFKSKLCLIISSPSLVYLGWTIDLSRAISHAL